ncbi:MAG: hypothetical protein QP772_07450, partial [Actinomycetaceae bacterium UMB1218B]|nr:hypothetical protein [Actinomycetaceae bacterium UMB1218B]
MIDEITSTIGSETISNDVRVRHRSRIVARLDIRNTIFQVLARARIPWLNPDPPSLIEDPQSDLT